jgi:lipoprotein-releasing system permease protein
VLAKGFEWGVARRYLLRPPKDGFISLNIILSAVAIMLGVWALLSVMAFMNGFRTELTEKILGYHGHTVVLGYNGRIDNYQPLTRQLSSLPDVVKVTPFTENQVMLMKDGRSWGAVVRGLPDELLTKDGIAASTVHAGSVESAAEEGGLILGHLLARRLGVGVGDEVTIVSPNAVSTPFGSTLRYLAYPVSAIAEIGVYQFDESFVGMPLAESQRFFRAGDTVSNIEVFFSDPELVDQYLPEISHIVGRSGYVRGWRSFNQALVGALETERVMMFLILSLIIVVAVFNVASSLVMLVRDKSGDIAILRTMGATRASIRRIFLIVGLTVGLFGIVGGSLLATVTLVNIQSIKVFVEWLLGREVWDPSVRFINSIRVEVNWGEVWLTIFVAIALTFLATILPAMRASRLDPVKILRHE